MVKNVVNNSKSNTKIRVSIKHFFKKLLWNINTCTVDNQSVNLNKFDVTDKGVRKGVVMLFMVYIHGPSGFFAC